MNVKLYKKGNPFAKSSIKVAANAVGGDEIDGFKAGDRVYLSFNAGGKPYSFYGFICGK